MALCKQISSKGKNVIRLVFLLIAAIGLAACQSSKPTNRTAKSKPLHTPASASERGTIVETEGGRIEVVEKVTQGKRRARLYQVDQTDKRIKYSVKIEDLTVAFEEVTGCPMPDAVLFLTAKDITGGNSLELPVRC